MTLEGEKLTGWNYRVVRRNVDDEIEYGIHEMYYDPDGWTADPVPVSAESVEGLRWQLNKMLLALECEVIDGTPSEKS